MIADIVAYLFLFGVYFHVLTGHWEAQQSPTNSHHWHFKVQHHHHEIYISNQSPRKWNDDSIVPYDVKMTCKCVFLGGQPPKITEGY